MEIFASDLGPDEDVDEDQRDEADHTGTGARLF
jgi:hypothetical protein